jgi:RNA polymerase sigma-70 factor (ECF subfamily)
MVQEVTWWRAAPPQYNDRVQQIPEGEFREVYERHAHDILRYAYRCVGRREIAEEIVSEAFLKMYLHRDTVDLSRAGAWLTTAVKNLATDYWRRQQVERRAQAEAAAAPEPEDPPVKWEEFIDHPVLKAEHRICLTLHYVHGMTNKEIVAHTGLTENQVKSAIQYGLKLLRGVHA